MNVAIYARVSSEKQAKDGTIQSQLEALREYAKDQGLNVLQECTDDGYSGADLNRPGLDQLRDLIFEGKITGVLALSPDRLSRNYAQQYLLLEDFNKQNIQVIFANHQLGDSPEDNMMLQMQGIISEYEREKILDRTRRGRKHAVENGQVVGGNTPFGYCYVRKTDTTPAHWEVDEREAETVRMIFDWYTKEGMKARAIVNRLEAEGIPSRSSYNKWWTSSIFAILKNETYIGMAYMFKKKKAYPAKHPKLDKYRKVKKSSYVFRPKDEWIGIPVTPIIERETWEKAQKLLKQNALKSSRNNKKNHYLLRGLVVCGLCGSMAPGYVSNKKTYYCCGAKRNKNITTKPHDESISVRHQFLDENVWAGLVELLDNPANLQEQLEKGLDDRNARINQSKTKPDKFDKELGKLDYQEQRIIEAYREGIISLEQLRSQKEGIANKHKALEAKRKAILSQLEGSGQPEITMEMLGDVSARFRRAMKKADFGTRQKLANLLINSVTLHSNKATVNGNIPVYNGDALVPARHVVPLQYYGDK